MVQFKRLYFDIEVSPNIGFFWQPGYKLQIPHDNIIKERAIICVCYKWEHEKEVHSLEWKKGNDKQLLIKFLKVLNEADEIVGQNSDNFDVKWLRTRCLYHKIEMMPTYSSVDTYKLAKQYFRFNSNKLDYMSSFLGYGNKIHTEYDLWKKIVLDNDPKAMQSMVKYCKKDVLLTEKVHQAMKNYTKHKTHVGVTIGETKIDCPECGSDHIQSRGYSITAAGTKFKRCQCQSCGKWYQVNLNVYNKAISIKNNKAIV
jgi:DNA polymerase elongation subunit (family B)